MGRLSAAAVVVAALIAFAFPAAATAATDWTKLRVLNISHQGGEDEAPSNTMYALDRSLRLGADMLEIDVHTSADGELIAIHDATVDRTTNGSGRIYDMTTEEIQALDAGYNTVPGEGTESDRPASDYPFRGVRTGERPPPPGYGPEDFRIPTLDEVIAAYPNVPLNIEIKGASDIDRLSYINNAEVLAAYLNELGRTDGIIVASFSDEAVLRFRQLAPQVGLAPAIVGVAGYKLAGLPPVGGTVAFQVPISLEGIPITNENFIRRAHRDGYAIHNWTINDPDEMRMLLGWGADGIMSAEPIRLEQVLCDEGYGRPQRPASLRGRHCNPKASIACEVEPTEVERKGRKRLRVTLTRRDEFQGQCAGRAVVKGLGTKARKKAKFDFGDIPPSAEGGVATQRVKIKLNRKLRRAIRRKGKVQVLTHPYMAFVAKRRVEVS